MCLNYRAVLAGPVLETGMVAGFFPGWKHGRVRMLAALLLSVQYSRGTDTCAGDLNAACCTADVQPTT